MIEIQSYGHSTHLVGGTAPHATSLLRSWKNTMERECIAVSWSFVVKVENTISELTTKNSFLLLPCFMQCFPHRCCKHMGQELSDADQPEFFRH